MQGVQAFGAIQQVETGELQVLQSVQCADERINWAQRLFDIQGVWTLARGCCTAGGDRGTTSVAKCSMCKLFNGQMSESTALRD